MNSFELNLLDEKSRAGSDFLTRVTNEIRRALIAEKKIRKLTQQSIAEKIGTSRSVINREVQGLENISARRIGELLWAIGWEPHFEVRRAPECENYSANDNYRGSEPAPTTGGTGTATTTEPFKVARIL